jgi:hypothetical protein
LELGRRLGGDQRRQHGNRTTALASTAKAITPTAVSMAR